MEILRLSGSKTYREATTPRFCFFNFWLFAVAVRNPLRADYTI